MKTNRRLGFTLIEVLFCVAIVVIITSIAFPLLSSARKKASMAREVASARKIIGAYLAYAAENDGELMPGYGNFPAKDELGKEVGSPINQRYPWRLAPYLQYDMRSFWGNEADDRIGKLAKHGPRDQYVYAVSVEPALGINASFVGGDWGVLPPDNAKALTKFGQFCVTRLGHATNAPQLIVFASAGGMYQGQRMSGYFKITAPSFTGQNWEPDSDRHDDPSLTGNVDFRYEDRAVAAMLDGHVELMDFNTMNDMRRWSNQAATAESPSWQLGNSEDSGGGPAETVPLGTRVTTNPTQ